MTACWLAGCQRKAIVKGMCESECGAAIDMRADVHCKYREHLRNVMESLA